MGSCGYGGKDWWEPIYNLPKVPIKKGVVSAYQIIKMQVNGFVGNRG
jgi:hypothetical protein